MIQLPGSQDSKVEQPRCDNCDHVEAENAKLRARLNDPHWMARRVMAILSKMKGPALVGVAGAAVLLMLAAWPLHDWLAGFHRPSSAAVGSPSQIRAGSHPAFIVERPSPSPAVHVPGEPSGGPASPPPLPSDVTMITSHEDQSGNAPKRNGLVHLPGGCLLHGDLQTPCRSLELGSKPDV
jgi:hypothetical protein